MSVAAQTTVAKSFGWSGSWVYKVDLTLYGPVHNLWTNLPRVRDRNRTQADYCLICYLCLNTSILWSTTMYFAKVWNNLSLLTHPLSFSLLQILSSFHAHHSPYHFGGFIEDHMDSKLQEVCGVWNMYVAAQTTLADFPGWSGSWVYKVNITLYGHVHNSWTKCPAYEIEMKHELITAWFVTESEVYLSSHLDTLCSLTFCLRERCKFVSNQTLLKIHL